MTTTTFIDNAKVMAKGQVTIPKDVREILGISSGDRVTFVVENGSVRLINSAVYAMQMLQAQMAGEAENRRFMPGPGARTDGIPQLSHGAHGGGHRLFAGPGDRENRRAGRVHHVHPRAAGRGHVSAA